jgi:deoxyribodipyrimidine photo-lyase
MSKMCFDCFIIILFVQPIDWSALEAGLEVDCTVGPVFWATPGTRAGLTILHEFCQKKLKIFGTKRNDPTVDALSNLSPWFHFGICTLMLLS